MKAKKFVKQLKNGTYNEFALAENGEKLWTLFPKFSMKDIPILLSLADDTTIINPFKHLITLSNELSAIRLQKDYLIQCQKNNALISELSKEIKALVIVQKELKEDRERFIKKDKFLSSPIEKIDLELELLKNQKSMIVENMDFDLGLKF